MIFDIWTENAKWRNNKENAKRIRENRAGKLLGESGEEMGRGQSINGGRGGGKEGRRVDHGPRSEQNTRKADVPERSEDRKFV